MYRAHVLWATDMYRAYVLFRVPPKADPERESLLLPATQLGVGENEDRRSVRRRCLQQL